MVGWMDQKKNSLYSSAATILLALFLLCQLRILSSQSMEKDPVPGGATRGRRTKEEYKELRRRLMKQPAKRVEEEEQEEEEEEEDTDLKRAFKKALPALRLETEQENRIMAVLRGFNSRDEHLGREIDDITENLNGIVERSRDFQKEIHEAIGTQFSEQRQK